MMKKLRVGIVGVGNIGTAHANSILSGDIKNTELTAVCDTAVSRAGFFKKNYPGIKFYDSYEKMLSSAQIDAVIIATPHKYHADMAMQALKHNMNVLVEKPVDIRVSKAKKLNSTAKEKNKIFAIMFNQRTNPLFKSAKEIVAGGGIGELKRTVWIVTNWYRTQKYYDSGGWRATWSGEGGGVLLNQAPHNLDLWQWICGMPESVTAFCNIGKYHNIEVEDDATILTRYKNGATGVFMTSTGEYPGTNRLEISGDSGKMVLENGTLKLYKLKEPVSKVIRDSDFGYAQIDYDYEEIKQNAPESSHKGILQNFANAVLSGEELIAPGTEGINELTISNAAYLSEWQGNREIHLPFDIALFDELLANKVKSSKYKPADGGENDSMSYLPRWQVKW